MKKFIFVIVLVVMIIIGGVFFIGTQLDSIVARLIESRGSAATQTPVRVDGVVIKVSGASAGFSNLAVGNPKGHSGNLIEMKNFSLTLDPGH